MQEYDKSKEPLLTAIIFTYNHEDSIAKCIESLVNQKTDYPYEIHIWNDASNDNTSDICREYAQKYPNKIRLVVQKENTFLKKDLELQSYAAIKNIKTKYFCIIDGDDYWCDENKVQIALDFLENNPEYIGFAHDTLQVNEYNNTNLSYIHEGLKCNIKNPVTLSPDAPFFLTSSRIFRKMDYEQRDVLPIDYLFYYYHLSKGPIYYYDKIMAVYVIGKNNTFANLKNMKDLNGMFSYRLSLLFNFKQDDFCTEMQKKYDTTNGVGDSRYKKLCLFKKIFGTKPGWTLWFIFTFAFKYGFEVMNINYVYPRKKMKEKADKKKTLWLKRKLKLERRLRRERTLESIVKYLLNSKLKQVYKIEKQLNYILERKRNRIRALEENLNTNF